MHDAPVWHSSSIDKTLDTSCGSSFPAARMIPKAAHAMKAMANENENSANQLERAIFLSMSELHNQKPPYPTDCAPLHPFRISTNLKLNAKPWPIYEQSYEQPTLACINRSVVVICPNLIGRDLVEGTI